MCTARDTVIFLAGAEFFHTLSYIVLPYLVVLPLNLGFMTLTSTMNLWVIGINAVITVTLLWYAGRIKH